MSWQNKPLEFDKALFAIMEGDQIVAFIANGRVDSVISFGTYTVVLYSYDDNNFAITDFGSQTLEVVVSDNSYVVEITFNSTSGKQYDGVAVTPTIVVTERISQEPVTTFTYTVTRNATTVDNKLIQDVGTYVVSVLVNDHVYKTATFLIEKRQITLEIGNTGNRVYNGQPIALDELSKSNFVWNGLVGDEDLSSFVTLVVQSNNKDAGTYTVTGTFAHNNYQATTITAGTFTINPKVVTVVVGNGTKVYDGNGIATWDDAVTISIADALQADLAQLVSLVKSKFVAIAQSDVSEGYDIVFADTTHQNYTITYQSGKYAITPRPITVTIDNQTSIYGDDLVELTATVTSGSLVTGHNLLGENGIVTLSKANGLTVQQGGYVISGANQNTNYNVTFVNGVYTITPRALTVHIAQDLTKVYDALEPNTSTFTYTVTDNAGAQTFATIPEGTIVYNVVNSNANVGTYTITAEVTNSTNYTYTVQNGKYTITPRQITLEIVNTGNRVYNGQPIALDELSKSNFVWNGLVGNEDLSSFVTLVVQSNNKDAGTYTVTGTFAHNNYQATTITAGTFTIEKLSIDVVVGDGYKVYDGNGVSAWDNNVTINIIGAVDSDRGELLNLVKSKFNPIAQSDANQSGYDITFAQTTHHNYTIAYQTGKYVIDQREIYVTLGATSTIYGEPIKTAQQLYALASVSGAVATDRDNLFEIATTATSGANAGSYNLILQNINSNYKLKNVVDGTGLYTVEKRNITVTIGNASKVYDATAPILDDSISITIDGALEQDIPQLQALVRNGFVAITQVDTNALGYPIVSTFDGNTNYNAPIYVNGKYVVEKRALTVTLANASSIYGDDVLSSAQMYALANIQGSADGDKQLFQLYTTATSTSNVGAYSILITDGSLDSNYFIQNDVDGSNLYAVEKRNVTVTINNVADHIYGEVVTADMLGASITTGNAVNGDKLIGGIVTLATEADATKSVGNYPITGVAINNNYDVTFVQGNFQIVARKVTVVISNQTSIYGQTKVAPTATVATSDIYGFVNGDNLYDYVTLSNPDETNVGTYDITGYDKSTSDNYTVTVTSGRYTINPRQIHITLGQISKVYDGQTNDLSNVEVSIWYQEGDQMVYLTTQLKDNVLLTPVTNTNVGTHTIQASFVNNNNYVVAQNGWTNGALTITPRPITLTIDNQTSVYGNATAELTSSVTSTLDIVAGDTNIYSLSCPVTSTTVVGNYPITGIKGTNTNYDVTFVNGNYTVTKRAISIKVEDATSEYDSAFVTPKLTLVDGSSLVGNDTLAQVVKAVWSLTNEAGSYPITAQLVDENNYTLQFVQEGSYTVTPIALTVSINPVSGYFGDAILTNDQLLVYATVSGKIAQRDADKQLFALQAMATNTDIVGNYDVVGTALDDNYSITFVNMQGKYQIAKRPVTLLVENATSIYSDADATLMAVVTQGNFAFGEQPSDFVTLTRKAGAKVGNYNITATKVQNALTSNYDVTVVYTMGDYSVYTITPRAVTFDISSFTIYNTDSWQKITSMFNGAVREDIGSDQLEISYKVLMRTITNGDQTQQVFLTAENLAGEIRLGNFEILATNSNSNYDVTFVNGTLTVILPRVSIGAITQNFTYNAEGIQLFDWQTQIVDYIPEITSASAFNAKLIDSQGNVILSGSVVSGVVDVGNYTLVIELVHTGQYAWADGVVTTYQVSVGKLDISDTIVEFGFTNGQWLTSSASGVYAMVQDNFDIYVDTTLLLDGQVVYDLTQCGNYTLVAVIDDANYCGQKTFTFAVIQDIAPTMATLNTMLNDYNVDDDFATRLESLTQMIEIVSALNNDDDQLQIENNVIYQQLVQNVTTRWNEFVEQSNQDMEVATSGWQNVVVQAVATISLLTAAAFVVSKRLGQ